MALDGSVPDRFDVLGPASCLGGVAVIARGPGPGAPAQTRAPAGSPVGACVCGWS